MSQDSICSVIALTRLSQNCLTIFLRHGLYFSVKKLQLNKQAFESLILMYEHRHTAPFTYCSRYPRMSAVINNRSSVFIIWRHSYKSYIINDWSICSKTDLATLSDS